MTPDQVIAEFERYEAELARILGSFRRTSSGIDIGQGDDPLYCQYARELVDLYNDALGSNSYSSQIAAEYISGFGYLGSPSFKGVENGLGACPSNPQFWTGHPAGTVVSRRYG